MCASDTPTGLPDVWDAETGNRWITQKQVTSPRYFRCPQQYGTPGYRMITRGSKPQTCCHSTACRHSTVCVSEQRMSMNNMLSFNSVCHSTADVNEQWMSFSCVQYSDRRLEHSYLMRCTAMHCIRIGSIIHGIADQPESHCLRCIVFLLRYLLLLAS